MQRLKQNRTEVVVLIFDKIDINTKKFTHDKIGQYTLIKGAIQQEGIRL